MVDRVAEKYNIPVVNITTDAKEPHVFAVYSVDEANAQHLETISKELHKQHANETLGFVYINDPSGIEQQYSNLLFLDCNSNPVFNHFNALSVYVGNHCTCHC